MKIQLELTEDQKQAIFNLILDHEDTLRKYQEDGTRLRGTTVERELSFWRRIKLSLAKAKTSAPIERQN